MVKLFKLSDTIRIRDYSNSDQYHDVTVSSVVDYIYSQYNCKSFYTRAPGSDAGVEVRAFNDNETVYLGDKSYLGITSSDIVESLGSNDGAINTSPSSYRIYYTGSSFARERDILTYPNKVVNNVRYYHTPICNSLGSSLLSYCGVYLPPTTKNIYINNVLQLNWENITVNLKHNIIQATILDMNAATANQECNYDTNTLFTPGTDFRDFAISGTEYNQDMIFADNELMLYQNNSTNSYIQCYSYYHSSSDNGGGWKIYYQGESIGGYTGGIFGKYNKYYGVAFLVDEENQVGQIIECYSYYPNTSWARKHHTRMLITNSNMLHKAYLLIKEILTGATVKVSYYLPDDTYTYSKLTYNSEHEPEDKDDGTSIDILPSNTSVNVEGLEEDTLYYFTIFTNKSESEPFPFSVV